MEDNSADVNLVQECLLEHQVNHTMSVIRDGEKAIQYIEDIDSGSGTCPDLIILDLNLPRRSGREVLRRIRLSSNCRNIPVMILSSSGAEKDRQEAELLGATLYIKKPTDLFEFLDIGATIKKLLAVGTSGTVQ